jgi:AcrR family transcriptional regulator
MYEHQSRGRRATVEDGFDLVWARPERPPRGRARGLSRQQIVRAAIAVADRDGLGALTMRGVAEELGAGTMSLYWHVRDKAELIELMRDQVAGELTLQAPSGDWRSDLATFARDVRQTFLRHPWLASLLGDRPALGPNSLRQDELSLAIVRGLEVDDRTRTAIPSVVYFFVAGYVLREVQRHTGVSEEQWRASVAPWIEQLLATGEYPNLERVVGGAGEPDGEAAFEFMLEFLLDGIQARLRR